MNKITVSQQTDIPTTVDVIRKLILLGSKNNRVKEIARECIEGVDQLQCVFKKVYDTLVYSPTPDEEQQLRTVENMFREGVGNCANYVTLIGSVLQNMGVKYKIRTVGYSKPNEFEHVYIVTEDGKVLDPVLGQKQDGTENRYIRPRKGKYNQEVKYKFKKDYEMPKLSILQGCEKANTPIMAKDIEAQAKYNGITRSKAVRFGIMPLIQKNKKVMGCGDCKGGCGK